MCFSCSLSVTLFAHTLNIFTFKSELFKHLFTKLLCLQLRTVTGNEFLLQSDTDSVTREWFNTIHNVIEKLVSVPIRKVCSCVHKLSIT